MASTALGKDALPMPPGFESYQAPDTGDSAWTSWRPEAAPGLEGYVGNGHVNGDVKDAAPSWKEHTDSTQDGSAWLGAEDGAQEAWTSWGQDSAVQSQGQTGTEPQSGLTGEADAIVQFVSDNWDSPEKMVLSEKTRFTDFGFSEKLLNGIYEMGFVKPSKVQEAALPIIAGSPGRPGQSLMAQAQNGSGKTAAFSLAVLSSIELEYLQPQAMVISPTRELAKQNQSVINELGKYLEVKTQLVCPGNDEDRCPRDPKAHILIGTPGKLSDLAKKKIINCWYVRTLVLDEADVMLSEENQMGSQIATIKQQLQDDLQVLFFSATFPDDVRHFGHGLIPNSKGIKVSKKDLTVSSVLQVYMNCATEEEKFNQLCNLYACLNVSQSIIFVNRRDKAFELAQRVKDQGHAVSLICGTHQTGEEKMDPAMRDHVMKEFREGVTKVLIATDVISRGIDVPQVTLVVNYELPCQWNQVNMETYLHRVGRTGRFGLKGIAVNLVEPNDLPRLEEIRNFYECKITEFTQSFDDLEDTLRKLR